MEEKERDIMGVRGRKHILVNMFFCLLIWEIHSIQINNLNISLSIGGDASDASKPNTLLE